MPKIKTLKPPLQQQLEDELRSRYGGMMRALDVARELGIKHHSAYEAWLADVPCVRVNRLRRWRCADVAAKIYRSMEGPEL